ncbi:MAG: S-methyl-5-thioribose-1-phosphate isomerase [Myxococcales bacterium]|nr:S-methyl-5-thioribose-1-phosphate isomerase [Myxococcales bacterium]
MKVDGQHMRSIELAGDGWSCNVIDQRLLPHRIEWASLETLAEACTAISEMWVRGAPLIGITAAYGVALAMHADPSDASLDCAYRELAATRPTAINLLWALDLMRTTLESVEPRAREQAAYEQAAKMAEQDVRSCEAIGEHGLGVLQEIAEQRDSAGPLRILTHCNAGWLATVDWGTALAPIYKAHALGIDLMVYVDETRPRNQGASLTAWELAQEGIPHALIVDNVGGHLMQHGMVDLCIVGSDRTTATGDVCNKIGTYLKALAAYDNDVPFFAALPFSTIDWSVRDGVQEIPIEERAQREVTHIRGVNSRGELDELSLAPQHTRALNFGFDVTPARLVTKIITERGVAEASEQGLSELYKLARGAHTS